MLATTNITGHSTAPLMVADFHQRPNTSPNKIMIGITGLASSSA
jgi:hypothetical protein